MIIRQSAVAGQFYPAQREELDAQLASLFDQTKKISLRGRPKILIVPHAGIVYSGKVAAWGFKQIENLGYSKIMLLGASHQTFFQHAAIFGQGVWETPLGKVAVDEGLAKKFLAKNILNDPSAHTREHSLELELIFLQKVLKDFKIIPVLISQPTEKVAEDLAEKISRALNDKTLLVVSSDLSHYLPWAVASEIDQKTIGAILSGQKNVFAKNLSTGACGYEAIKISLRVAEILKIKNFQKIKYQNSGDITGEKAQVVGYTSIIGYA